MEGSHAVKILTSLVGPKSHTSCCVSNHFLEIFLLIILIQQLFPQYCVMHQTTLLLFLELFVIIDIIFILPQK